MNKDGGFSGTVDAAEIKKFSDMADQWWDPNGPFKPLHRLNPVRLHFIRDKIETYFSLSNADAPLKDIKILDIGCGGGLLAEPLTRLGATVTGVDASEKNIRVARARSEKTGLFPDYRNLTAEALVEIEPESFDVVLAMEVAEHVADLELFCASCAKLLKPGGLLFFATLNRTVKSFLLAIVGAEYILGWLPKGTHEFAKFIKPEEIDEIYGRNGLSRLELKGVSFNILTSEWRLTADTSVNYMEVRKKNGSVITPYSLKN